MVDRLQRTDEHGEEADANAFLPRDPHACIGSRQRRQHRLGAERLQLLKEASRIIPVIVVGGGVRRRANDAEIWRIGSRRAGDDQVGHATFTMAALSGSSFAKARW
jgi:hypothetical protein